MIYNLSRVKRKTFLTRVEEGWRTSYGCSIYHYSVIIIFHFISFFIFYFGNIFTDFQNFPAHFHPQTRAGWAPHAQHKRILT